jgi:hypothetical protein
LLSMGKVLLIIHRINARVIDLGHGAHVLLNGFAQDPLGWSVALGPW